MRHEFPPPGAESRGTPSLSSDVGASLSWRWRVVAQLACGIALLSCAHAVVRAADGFVCEPTNGDNLETIGRLVAEITDPRRLTSTGKHDVSDLGGTDFEKAVEFILDLSSRYSSLHPLQPASGSQSNGLTVGRETGYPIASASRPSAFPPDAEGAGNNISRDATTIVGYSDQGGNTVAHAFRWTAATGIVDLGSVDPANNATLRSFAADVSSDGSVVVGKSWVSITGIETIQHAFRWTQSTGMVDLGSNFGPTGYSAACSVSGDGSVIVGESDFAAPPGSLFDKYTTAFRWTQAGGFQSLGSLDGSLGYGSVAASVSADGATVVGWAVLSGGINHAFRWTAAGGMQDLGVLPGQVYSAATGVSDDGTIVVGRCSPTGFGFTVQVGRPLHDASTFGPDDRAFYWTAATGMRDLTQLLIDAGADMAGKTLVAARGISPDGKWINAVTTIPDPEDPSFRLQVPIFVSLTETLPPPSRLVNLSTRGTALTGDNVLIPGFVIGGTANRKLLLRAVGPTLTAFNVTGVLPDPIMALKRTVGNATIDIASNDNWSSNGNAAEIVTTSTAVGAFALDAGSLDSALLVDLEPGQYTVVTQGVSSSTGVAIVELYDGDAGTASSQLVNISTRGFVGAGDSIMIPGYVVSNDGSARLLIRAVGPTLATFNVSGVLADPQLEILKKENDTFVPIASNDNWGSAGNVSAIKIAMASVSAFALPDGSKDAAVLIQLLPGIYTVKVSGIGNGTGVALAEVYVVP
jgi:probable HAF family extracellular repeat protein